MLLSFKKGHRQDIRKSNKKDLKFDLFSNGEQEGIDRFIKVMKNRQTSKRYGGLPEQHYRNIWNSLSSSKSIYVIVGSHDGEDFGAYFVAYDKTTAYQLHGARTKLGRQLRLAPRLSMEVMLAAKSLGLMHYDMWGVGTVKEGELIKTDPEYGLGKYKKDFGGTLVELSEQRFVINSQLRFRAFQIYRYFNNVRLRLKRAI